jgi:polyisoprenoid-binding protein YceI
MAIYKLDPSQGRLTVQAFAEGMLSSFGHNPTFAIREFSGEVEFDSAAPNDAKLQVVVIAASLELTDDVSSKDRREIETRMRDEVLEPAKYPKIVFRSSSVAAGVVTDNQFRLEVQGKLALHGSERNEPIEIHVRAGGADMRLRGEWRIKQSGYQIKRVSAVGGAIRVKDELKLAFELVALKQE